MSVTLNTSGVKLYKDGSAVTDINVLKADDSDITGALGYVPAKQTDMESVAQSIDKQLLEMETALKSGLETDAAWHLGFYLDENGDLCQVESEEE